MSFPPPSHPELTLVKLLRSTLHRLEESPEHDPEDPEFKELKRSILLSIAQLELQRQSVA